MPSVSSCTCQSQTESRALLKVRTVTGWANGELVCCPYFLKYAWRNLGQVTRPAGGESWFRQAGLEPVTLLVDTPRLGPHSFHLDGSYLKHFGYVSCWQKTLLVTCKEKNIESRIGVKIRVLCDPGSNLHFLLWEIRSRCPLSRSRLKPARETFYC